MKITEFIEIRGARVHNLKNIDLDIPIQKLTCFYGPSGSGKSSLAFHTLYTESKRRFLNSFPTYMKFFSDRPAPVDVDSIKPVLPVFGLPQINPVMGTRSNVLDVMQLTELMQAHFYHYSKELCPRHRLELVPETFSTYISQFLREEDDTYTVLITGEDFLEFFSGRPFPSRSLKSKRSKKIEEFDKEHGLWEVLRFKPKMLKSLDEKIDPYVKLNLKLFLHEKSSGKITDISFRLGKTVCPEEGCFEASLEQVEMMHFSPYNPLGACPKCGGFGETLEYDLEKLVDHNLSVSQGGVKLLNYKRFVGIKENLIMALRRQKISTTRPIRELGQSFWKILYQGEGNYVGFEDIFQYLESRKYKMNVRVFIRNIQKNEKCKECHGTRLKSHSRNFFLSNEDKSSLYDLLQVSLSELYDQFKFILKSVNDQTKESKKSLRKIIRILKVANDLGLGHLQGLRKSKSLSAGEYQRLLLLKYLSYEGTGSLFVFDEPSLGLEQSQLKALLKGFRELIDQGNTVILVDHHHYLQKGADYLVKLGPEAGAAGGEIVYYGQEEKRPDKLDMSSLSAINLPKSGSLKLKSAEIYQKKYSDVEVHLKGINLVRGPSGSGKTSLYINILANELNYKLKGEYLNVNRGCYKALVGKTSFDDIIIVNSNLNRYTSRSTVGSLTGLFPVVRKHFLKRPLAKAMGLQDGHFSYNSQLGQCPKCEGRGVQIVEMQFLEDIVLTCEDCEGKKLKPHYASFSDGEMTVHESFTRPLHEVLDKVSLTPKFKRIREYLKVLNLDYLSLDRQINSLSGGERQRIYLLSKVIKNLENSFLVFENISFGLSERELIGMAKFLQDLSLKGGNTIVIIDQHPIFEHISCNIKYL